MRIKDKDFPSFFQKDMESIGTKNYKGYGYFWHFKYRHSLRDTTPNIRRKIHNAMLSQGLPLNGQTSEHDAIVNRFRKYKEHQNAMQKKFSCTDSIDFTQADNPW